VLAAAPTRDDRSSQDVTVPVSIITVCLNAAATLERCLSSVASQGEGVEHIVIDGGSTDGSLEIIERHAAQIAYRESRPDNGIFDALNKGLTHATGAVIGIAHADDFLEPGAVTKVRAAFLTTGGTAILAGLARVHASLTAMTTVPGPIAGDLMQASLRGMPISHAAMFVPQKIYDRIGHYDARYRYAGDYDFVLRCLHRGVRIEQMPAVLSNFQLGGRSARYAARMLREERSIKLAYGVSSLKAWAQYFKSRLAYSMAYGLMRSNMGTRVYFKYLRCGKSQMIAACNSGTV